LQKKEKAIKSREFIEMDEDKKMQEELDKKEKEVQKYKALLEEVQE
jgi:hypothetical protein